MSTNAILIFAAVAAVIVILYFVTMRVFFKESKELDKKIDYGKMKEWKDDD
jgi:low affinity Fe/Cu permease